MVEKIVLDTNFLLIPARFKVDIFSELRRVLDVNYSLCIPDLCLAELRKISAGKGKAAREAKLGLQLVRQKGISILKTGRKGHTDDVILELAEKERFITATQDLRFAKRLSYKGLSVIFFTNKGSLEFSG